MSRPSLRQAITGRQGDFTRIATLRKAHQWRTGLVHIRNVPAKQQESAFYRTILIVFVAGQMFKGKAEARKQLLRCNRARIAEFSHIVNYFSDAGAFLLFIFRKQDVILIVNEFIPVANALVRQFLVHTRVFVRFLSGFFEAPAYIAEFGELCVSCSHLSDDHKVFSEDEPLCERCIPT